MSGFLNTRRIVPYLALLLTVPTLAMAGPVQQNGQSTQQSSAPTSRQSSPTSGGQTAAGSSRPITSGQQAHIRAQAREFRQMSPQQQSQVRRAYRYYNSLPPARRNALRNQWKHQAEREKALQPDPRTQPRRTGPGSQ